MKKQRTVAKFRADPAPKSFRKTRSQSLIPEEILLSKFVNIDISDEPKEEKKNDVVRPDEIVKVKETLPTNPIETPTAISKVRYFTIRNISITKNVNNNISRKSQID